MEDKKILETALQKIANFREAILNDIPDSMDKRQLLGYIDDAILSLKNSKKADNKILIKLEKFYQYSSMIIGLSTLKLDGVSYATWRDYDKFHFDNVKPNLKLYGNVFLM